MKKLLLVLVVILSAIALAMVGCNNEEAEQQSADKFEAFTNAYSKVSEAIRVEQKTEIKENSLVVYVREKNYQKSGNEYTVTVKEKRLNDLSADKPYTETETSSTGQAGDFAGILKLAESCFENFEITNDKLTVSVKSGKEGEVFPGADLSGVKDLKLEMTVKSEKLSTLKITYLKAKNGTSDYVCALTFGFTY